jgi:hypothetical protein
MSQYQYERSGNRQRALIFITAALACLLIAVSASAHTPLLYIEDNEDGTIYIEGGFSDGSSAAGIPVRMEDADGNTLWKGVLDEFGVVESTLIPEVEPYYVIFDAGPGHVVTKEGIYPSAAVEPEDDAPSNGTQDVPVTPSASATPESPALATPTAPPATAWSSDASSPAWMTGTTNAQAGSSADSVLWVIVALLAFIALALLVLCGGVLFFVGWTVGRRGRQV